MVAFLLVGVLAACDRGRREPRRASRQQPGGTATSGPRPPNVVFILTDDLDTPLLDSMPHLRRLMTERGTSFASYFVTDSLCCPSRASILRGQYVHNHRIAGNEAPLGGFEKFRELGCEESTVATWLQRAGYRTALLGKYLNRYPGDGDRTCRPAGTNGRRRSTSPPRIASSVSNERNGRVSRGKAPADYLTDVLAAKAVAIADAATRGVPFFLYLAPYGCRTRPHAGGQ
jgi:arylsulfatase A-like enzyme